MRYFEKQALTMGAVINATAKRMGSQTLAPKKVSNSILNAVKKDPDFSGAQFAKNIAPGTTDHSTLVQGVSQMQTKLPKNVGLGTKIKNTASFLGGSSIV